jgi:elongation factor Ts
MITANMVKELREQTGAGMLDCKKALTETNGNMEEATTWLREKGISKAAKKQSRIAAEGLAYAKVNGNKAVIVEVNSETDFVAKNAEFQELVEKIGKTILASEAKSVEDALELDVDGQTINDLIVAATAKIGEKLSLRRFELITKKDDEIFGSYLHMGGKISSLIVLKGGNDAVAKDIAMQSAAMKPSYVSRDEVPTEEVEHERSVLTSQAIEEGKKPEFVDKIIEGRLSKYFEEVCLVDQAFVKDSGLTVKAYLEQNNAEVTLMVRYEVGEGMEKRSDNFAEEVMSQIK